jgi:integrase
MKLMMTAKWVESVKPTETQKDYFDADCPGLSLRVTPNGVKTWCLLYRHEGRLRRLTLGTYHASGLNLQKARNAGHDKRGAAQLGADPAAEKKAKREADTFGELAEQYLAAKKHKRSIREDTRIVNVYLKRFDNVKAGSVARSDIGAMLQTIAADAPIMANRVLACIRGIFNWAISSGILESSPCVLLKAPAPEKKRTRSLSDEEIKKVWAALETADSASVADIYKLRLLTAQRGGEVMGMAWAEIDMQNRWWTIPEGRSKNKKAHRVWLSDPVLRILKRRQAANDRRKKRAGGPSLWVFPGKRRGKHLVEPKRAFADIVKASGVKNWTGHDLRRTAATSMTRYLKVNRFVVERVLNHAEDSKKAIGHYDTYEYDAEKKDVLERWGKRLTLVVSDLKKADSQQA